MTRRRRCSRRRSSSISSIAATCHAARAVTRVRDNSTGGSKRAALSASSRVQLVTEAPTDLEEQLYMNSPLLSPFTAGSWSNAGVPWQHVADSREHSAAATEPALLLLLTRAAETGPRTSWSHQSFATIMEQNNTLSVIMFMAMFGGSTFLLFLLCYCCQRKMRENAFAPLDNATMAHHPQVSTNLAPQTTQIMPSGPPPNYDAVVKKDPADLEPPPYEVAVASLQASGYV
ncbi:hypothetical protein MRX96_019575 [Rhipicephalus microplus]